MRAECAAGCSLNFQVELGRPCWIVSIFHVRTEVRNSLLANPRCYRVVNSSEMAVARALRSSPNRMSRESYQRALVLRYVTFSHRAVYVTTSGGGPKWDILRDGSVTRDIFCARSFQISAANNDRSHIRIIMC